jgi:hypothetical protein
VVAASAFATATASATADTIYSKISICDFMKNQKQTKENNVLTTEMIHIV